MNVPAGTGTPGSDDGDGGEGKHSARGHARPGPGRHEHDGSGDDVPTPTDSDDREWRYAFRSVSATIVHSSGTQFIFPGWAGIDVLGVDDKCTFGGVVEVIQG